MVRMQVYITEGQRRLLERKARAQGQPVAALIRKALDLFLGGGAEEPDPETVLAATFGALPDLRAPDRAEWDRAAESAPTYE